MVVDATRPSPTLPAALWSRFSPVNALVAVNKMDLPERAFAIPVEWTFTAVEVSALTGYGIDELRNAVIRLLDLMTGSGIDDELVAVNARHAASLAQAVGCLERATVLLGQSEPLELAGSELRGALDALGAIVGRIDNEAMLDRLFAAFCIGK
jgi:tRNA modification GTPase